MSTAAAPVRQLDERTVSELREAAEQILAESDTSTPSPPLLRRVEQAAAAFGDALRHHCRPVDTADGLFVLRGIDVDDDALGPTPDDWATAGESGARYDVQLLLLAAVMGNPSPGRASRTAGSSTTSSPRPGTRASRPAPAAPCCSARTPRTPSTPAAPTC
ncbi:hypothetical protein [Streptomyces sirii]|uniref:hypothetical protein n=1 Tax=Streptomyces sirii TaxID=3127701 RepID=UPI003D364163